MFPIPKRVMRADRVRRGDVVHMVRDDGEELEFTVEHMWMTAAPNIRLEYSVDGNAGFVDLAFNRRLLVIRPNHNY
jgi:hypothetical protein